MNPVLILCHNCIELTKRCVESVKNQDLETSLYFVDNGSTDGTADWARAQNPAGFVRFQDNSGVSKGWNLILSIIFSQPEGSHCLIVNNDVVLPPWFYSELLSYKVPFVSGVSAMTMERIQEKVPRGPLVTHPDFSAFLIRRSAWQEIGPFDEGMKFYAQDCDYHLRGALADVPLFAANCPFYHERSSTLRSASPEERVEIEGQANRDRAFFLKKWGFPVGSEEYQQTTQSKAGTNLPFPGEIKFLA